MEWPILLKGEKVGTITSAQTGANVELKAVCPFAEGWIYRLYLGSEDEPQKIYLGVMLPEEGSFVLRKRVSARSMEAARQKGALGGVVVCHRPGEPEPPLELHTSCRTQPTMGPLPFSERDLGPLPEKAHYVHEIFSGCGGRYVRWEGVDYWLAAGSPGEPVGPVPFFCLLTWVPWKEGGWWVLCTDEDGMPYPIPSSPE